MVIAQLINLNVSCKLHPYSFQRTQLPPGLRLPKKIRNTHPRNYYDLKGKDIDVHIDETLTGQNEPEGNINWKSNPHFLEVPK